MKHDKAFEEWFFKQEYTTAEKGWFAAIDYMEKQREKMTCENCKYTQEDFQKRELFIICNHWAEMIDHREPNNPWAVRKDHCCKFWESKEEI